MWIEEKDSSGKVIQSQYFDPINSEIIVNNWRLNRRNIKLTNPENHIFLLARGADYFVDSIYIDNIIVRPIYHDVVNYNIENNDTVALIINNISCAVRDKKFSD